MLTGCSRVPWRFWMVKMTISCLNVTSYFQSTPKDEGSSKSIQRCSWQVVPGRYDISEWFKCHTLLLSCLDMTSQSQLTIVNLSTCRLSPHVRWWILQMSLKMQLIGCSRTLNGWNDILWYCPYVSMTFHSQLTIANLCTSCLSPISDESFKYLVSWRFWMVQMTHLKVSLPWYDISFSGDNCQLPCKLSTPNRRGFLQMSSKMQFMGAMAVLNGSNDVVLP